MEKMRITFISAVLFVVILAASSCRHKSKSSAAVPPLRVEVAEASSMMLYDQIEVASQIKSLYDAVVQPRVSGFLRSINFREGMPVRRGDLLFEIEPSQYNISLLAAQAELESAQAQEALAHSNYLRALPLVEIDAISRSDMDQYTATHKAAQAAVKSARESLNNAKLNLGYTLIYAPIDGLVAESPASVGDYVGLETSQSTLTTISYIDTVQVEIPIPTTLYLQNVPSDSRGSYDNSSLLSEISLKLAGGKPYDHQGTYHYTLKNTPSASSTIVVVAKFPNPDMNLKAGMFARIVSNIGEPKARVVVPQVAVSQDQGVNSVWVVRPDSIVELRKVSLGATYGKDWIVDEGLTEGENVLISGQLKVHNGAKVAPTKR